MKAEIRETLGKAVYASILNRAGGELNPSWENLSDDARAYYAEMAESVVKKLAELAIIPVLNVLLSENDIKRMLEQV